MMKLPAFIKPRIGVAFKSGKFYDFSERRIVVIRAWPDPMAWVKTPKRPWKGTRKWADVAMVSCFRRGQRPALQPPPLDDFKLTPGAMEDHKADGLTADEIEKHRILKWKMHQNTWREDLACVQPFIEQIPAEIRAIIAPLHHRAWHMLTMLARCPGALDLSRSNPALAFALSGHWFFREKRVTNPLRSTRALVYRRQRDILAWLGFPSTKSTQRIFQKIEINELHPVTLLRMRKALQDPACRKVLTHLPVIKPEVLKLVVIPELFARVSMRFLHELSASDGRLHGLIRIFYDTIRMDRLHGGGHLPACFHSIHRMHQAHDDLTARGNRIALSRNLIFPDPPYAGSEHCQPIRTLNELVREGEQMRHCVASYEDLIVNGSYYVYRVLQPVRATMAIRWRGNCWMVHEVEGFANSLLSASHVDQIVDSFFEGTCLRGPLPSSGPRSLPSMAETHDEDPRGIECAVCDPPPWVPCDNTGQPLLLFSPAVRNAADTIRSVFTAA